MTSMLVFRVRFSGPALSDRAKKALEAVEGRWEGSLGLFDDPGPQHHRVLVGALTGGDAVALVKRTLERHGAFADFEATAVRNRRGDVWHTPIRKGAWEIDWDGVEAKAELTELQRTLVQGILDAAEPTWILLKDPDTGGDTSAAEAALRDLERRGLVGSTWEPSGDPEFGVVETWRGVRLPMCHWWALTDEGWEVLGLIKSPGYH
jgi:hypothetical protein